MGRATWSARPDPANNERPRHENLACRPNPDSLVSSMPIFFNLYLESAIASHAWTVPKFLLRFQFLCFKMCNLLPWSARIFFFLPFNYTAISLYYLVWSLRFSLFFSGFLALHVSGVWKYSSDGFSKYFLFKNILK
jgi:hypothetical protein